MWPSLARANNDSELAVERRTELKAVADPRSRGFTEGVTRMCDVCVLAAEASIRHDGRLRSAGRTGAGAITPTLFESRGPRRWAALARRAMELAGLTVPVQPGTAAGCSEAGSARTGTTASAVAVRQVMVRKSTPWSA